MNIRRAIPPKAKPGKPENPPAILITILMGIIKINAKMKKTIAETIDVCRTPIRFTRFLVIALGLRFTIYYCNISKYS